MSVRIEIPVKVLRFTKEQYNDWVNGDREGCSDSYLRKLPDSFGFGEFIVGQHFASQGYSYIHHDFNVFGGNRPGKYPAAEEILTKYLGEEKYSKVRHLYPEFRPLEEPDLLIYKPDGSEIRFAESKRFDTRDKLRESQVKGLALLSLLLGCKVDIFEVVEEGVDFQPEPVIWNF